MRDYRFRGKRLDNGEWVYGYYLKSASTFIAVDGGLVDGHFELYEVDPETVGQFTGSHDKNGKEIYEGDRIRVLEVDNKGSKEYQTDIKWEDCAFVMKSGGDDYDTFLAAWCGNSLTTYPMFEIEIIGTIHDQKAEV
jgi:uncharacterized phage protein (TIGR01671 family)